MNIKTFLKLHLLSTQIQPPLQISGSATGCLVFSESGEETIVDSLLKLPCERSTTLLMLMFQPTISLPLIWSRPTDGLHVSGGGQPLATTAPSWRHRTSWWVCLITQFNCYCDWTPIEGILVAIRDIVIPMMQYYVRFHLVLCILDWAVHHC